MRSYEYFQRVRECPGMFFHRIDFDIAASFVHGFDAACCGGILRGFNEWLIPRLGYGCNLAWSEVALHFIMKDVKDPRKHLSQSNHEIIVDSLFELLQEFWDARDGDNGIRMIYIR